MEEGQITPFHLPGLNNDKEYPGEAVLEGSPIPADLLEDKAAEGAKQITDRIEKAGFDALVVGGAARDVILGRKISDWDIATNAPLDVVMSLFEKVVPTGLKYQTVTVMLFGRAYEVTARGGPRGSFPGFVHLELARRDFTINAMAFHIGSRRLFDPYRGMEDLREGIIRAVKDPYQRFREDPLRMMRAFRFQATMNCKIDKKTLEAIHHLVGLFKSVAAERIRDELLKILEAKRPSRALEAMRKAGLLGLIIPELLEGYRKKDEDGRDGYDIYHHSLLTMDLLEGPPILRLAGLLHDIGKPRVRKRARSRFVFIGHELEGRLIASRIMDRLRFGNQHRDHVAALVENHMVDPERLRSDIAIRRFLARTGYQQFEQLLALRHADMLARKSRQPDLGGLCRLQKRIERMRRQAPPLKRSDLAVDGEEVMRLLNIGPGPRVGEILDHLLEVVIERPEMNVPEYLKGIMLEMGKRGPYPAWKGEDP